MVEPTAREVALAAELDLAIVEEETECGSIEEQTARVQVLIAAKLAEYRVELASERHFIMDAAQSLNAHLLPKRVAGSCECNLLMPARMRCSKQIARCRKRCREFADAGDARDAATKQTTTAQSGDETEQTP